MDLEPTSEQRQLQQSLSGFFARNFSSSELNRGVDSHSAVSRDQWRDAAAVGLASIALPEPHGAGGSVADLVIAAEEAGRALYSGPVLASAVVGHALSRDRSDRSATLDALACGEIIAAWVPLPDEPHEGAVVLTGEGASLRLSGHVAFVQDAGTADLLLIEATAGESAELVLLPRDSPGVRTTRREALDLTRQWYSIDLDDVVVGEGQLLDPADQSLVTELHALAALLIAADSVGGSAAILEESVRYALQRETFGRVIGSYQAIKHKCADMLIWTESSRVATYYAAALATEDGLDEERTLSAIHVAKAYSGDAYPRVTGEALQIHGGIGYAWEHVCHLFLRRARMNRELFGSPRLHRGHLVTR